MNPLLASWLIAVSTSSASLEEFRSDPAKALARAGVEVSAEMADALRSADPRVLSVALRGSVDVPAEACPTAVVGEPNLPDAPAMMMCVLDIEPIDDPVRS
jgi:hypothetical protein